MSQQSGLTSRRPRLHCAVPSRPATQSPRSRWLQDVTGLREGDQRDPPPPSADERLEELKEQLFKNRDNNNNNNRAPGRRRGTVSLKNKNLLHTSEDPSLIYASSTPKTWKRKPSSFFESSPVEIEQKREKSQHRKCSATTSFLPPSPVEMQSSLLRVVDKPTPSPQPRANSVTQTARDTAPLSAVPQDSSLSQKWSTKASKSVSAKDAETAVLHPKSDAIESFAVASLQTNKAVSVTKLSKDVKPRKATSWLRRAVATLDASTKQSTIEQTMQPQTTPIIREQPPALPTLYTHETSPLQQQLWMVEIWKALNEVKVTEELLYSEEQTLVARAEEMNDTMTETMHTLGSESVLPTRLPDYYAPDAGVRSNSEEDDDEDDEESISSMQVLLNWCCGEYYINTAPVPLWLNARGHLVVVATE